MSGSCATDLITANECLIKTFGRSLTENEISLIACLSKLDNDECTKVIKDVKYVSDSIIALKQYLLTTCTQTKQIEYDVAPKKVIFTEEVDEAIDYIRECNIPDHFQSIRNMIIKSQVFYSRWCNSVETDEKCTAKVCTFAHYNTPFTVEGNAYNSVCVDYFKVLFKYCDGDYEKSNKVTAAIFAE